MKDQYDAQRLKDANAEYATRPERAAYTAKREAARALGFVGVSFLNFCAVERNADDATRAEIAARHNVKPFKMF
jgi:hypothetical protein